MKVKRMSGKDVTRKRRKKKNKNIYQDKTGIPQNTGFFYLEKSKLFNISFLNC